MRIIKPGDPDFHSTGSPFAGAKPAPTNQVHPSMEVQLAFQNLLKALAGGSPELIPHLTVGGMLRITTNSKAVIELPFAGIAGGRA